MQVNGAGAGAKSAAPWPLDAEAGLGPAWAAAWRAWLENGSHNTFKAYDMAGRQFFEWAGRPPWAVSPELAEAWAAHLAGQGLADRTINLKLSAMASFYNFVARYYRAQGAHGPPASLWPAGRPNPFQAVPRPRVYAYARARSPSLEEVRAMLAAINTGCRSGARDFALLVTILVTCRRAAQVLGISWGDIQPLEGGGYAFAYRDRAGRIRQAGLPRVCYQAMCAYLEMDGRPPAKMRADDTIFIPLDPERVRRLPGHACQPSAPNRPLSASFANRMLKKYARRAGVALDKAHMHGLRHAGARLRVRLMAGGGRRVDYAQVKRLLGQEGTALTGQAAPRFLGAAWPDPGGDAVVQALLPAKRSGQAS